MADGGGVPVFVPDNGDDAPDADMEDSSDVVRHGGVFDGVRAAAGVRQVGCCVATCEPVVPLRVAPRAASPHPRDPLAALKGTIFNIPWPATGGVAALAHARCGGGASPASCGTHAPSAAAVVVPVSAVPRGTILSLLQYLLSQ
jgi:hypothetical protein